MPSRSFTTDVFVSNWTDIITISLHNYKNISFTKEKVKKVTFRALIHAQTALPPHIEAQSDTFLQSLFSTVFPQQETPTTKILLAKFSLTGLFNRKRKPL